MKDIVLHLKQRDIERDFDHLHLRLYRIIAEIAADHGAGFSRQQRDKDIRVGTRKIADDRFNDGRLHIIDDRSLMAPHVLNAAVAYFPEYWHLDPEGSRSFSGIGNKRYDPEAVSPQRAAKFFANMKKRYVERRRSRYGKFQEVRRFPEGAISVFFQGHHPLAAGATEYDDLQMLQVVQNFVGDRPILVRMHPLVQDEEAAEVLKARAAADERIRIVTGNIHDILSASHATVSVNSTVALEGFLHQIPAVLFGTSDFHHFAGRVVDPNDFAPVLEQELQRKNGYDRYLAWYFLKNCFQLNSGKIKQDITEVLLSDLG